MADFSRETWAEMQPILDRVLDMPSSDRAGFLAQACSNDPALRADVERLLEAAEQASSFLDMPALAYAAPLVAHESGRPVLTPGERLGPYEVLRELGAGGMGTVFLAHDHKHDRDVALKVLHHGLAAMLGAERFSQEISISAKLDHPHILTLIDSGEREGLFWYVVPYVRGESLRDRLAREKRLPVGDAVRIATQVASALDYAHHRGVIHRDVKPENILLHEGEAMVADFGIALAVEEAGGKRLSDSGLRLGTPRYMSPEQARGDVGLDARTDIYSLGAVAYEMLSGTPPHAAESVEALLSKVIREPPRRLRIAVDDIPDGVDAAVMKALSKAVPDRFDNASDFARALARALEAASSRQHGHRALYLTAIGIGAVVVVAAIALFSRSRTRPASSPAVVRDRVQLTFVGNAFLPAISADGRRIAYAVRRCDAMPCRLGIEIQDVGGGPSRRILDGATALYGLTWSPDGRHIEFRGTIATRFGAYIVSTAGDAPRLVVAGPLVGFSFMPTGDSLLVTKPLGRDGIGWLRVTALDSTVHDSIPIKDPGGGMWAATMLAGGRWIVVPANVPAQPEWRIVDRHGNQRDVFRVTGGQTSWVSWRVTGNALWLALWSEVPGERRVLIRRRIDTRTGRFEGPPDTVLATATRVFDVTADGTSIVYADGTTEFDARAVDLQDALHGRVSSGRRLLSSTSVVRALVSPDGERVLLRDSRGRVSVVPYRGGSEVHHSPAGSIVACMGWAPGSRSFVYAERAGRTLRLVTVDASTGVRRSEVSIADSSVTDCTPLADGGWVWRPYPNTLRVQQRGDPRPRDLPVPPGYEALVGVSAGPDRSRFATMGWNATGDSIHLSVVSLPNGNATRWATVFAEASNAFWLDDGSIMMVAWESSESAALYRVWGPGRAERVGTIPLPAVPAWGVAVSSDGQRLTVVTRQNHNDIWMVKVASAR